ncbi:MAG TPA: (Fe-S)-binding protein [Bacilli bacterium]
MILGVFQTYFLPAILLAATGGIFGVLIGVFSKVFAVEVDDRIQKLIEMLPGYNCGACGYPGCSGMAQGLAKGEADPASCKPSKEEMREKIRQFLKENYKK